MIFYSSECFWCNWLLNNVLVAVSSWHSSRCPVCAGYVAWIFLSTGFLDLGKPHGGLTTLSLGSSRGEVQLCRALGQGLVMGLFLHPSLQTSKWVLEHFLQTRGSSSSQWTEPCFPYAMEGCGPQPCSLSVCVSNAMHFPVVINPLGTKPSNNGCSVPGPELDLQSPVCSSLRGSWL